MPATQPEPPCCSNPSPLIPIVIIAALFILAVVIGAILYQQDKIATQRQQLDGCTNHIQALQTTLQEAKCERGYTIVTYTNSTEREMLAYKYPDGTPKYFKIEKCVCHPAGFTNTVQYPPKFMLKD